MPEGFTPTPYGQMCNPCAQGKHDKCKTDVYHQLEKKRLPCNCPLRTMPDHP